MKNGIKIALMVSMCFSVFYLMAQEIKSQLPTDKKWKLIWHDEFNGNSPDTTKWGFRLHIMQTRHQTFTTEGVEVKNGLLHLNLVEKDGQYYSAHLQTWQNYLDSPGTPYTKGLTWPIAEIKEPKFVHKYGYYEIRCKLQKQLGWWSAFWLHSPIIGSSLDPARADVEMDIMENFTRDNKISHNIHWDGYGKDHKHKGSGSYTIAETPDGFHTFGMYWGKSGYDFYVDGKESWHADGLVSDIEQFILVSTECDGYRNGKRDQPSERLKKTILPDAFVMDYVSVFDEIE